MKLFVICLTIAIFNGYFFNFINDTFFHLQENAQRDHNLSKNEFIFLVVVIAPFLETFIFQYLGYKLFSNILKIKNDVICIFLMSFVFSQAHWYNWFYVITTFFGGIILNYYYTTTLKKYNYSFVLTVLFHSLYNLYGLLFVGT